MQLTLLTPLAPRTVVGCPVAPRGEGALARDAVAVSQLDRIAAANGARGQGSGLGSAATWLALLGGLVVLGAASLWQGDPVVRPQRALSQVATVAAPATAVAARTTTATPAALPAPAPSNAAPSPSQTLAAAAPAPAVPVEAVAPKPVAAPEAVPDDADAARRARARQIEQARRKAALLAQEQARADELQRQQQQQQREAERQLALADRARLAAERAKREVPARVAAADVARGVRETCSGTGFFGEQVCRTRTCARAEHQADPICVQQREALAAQLRAGADR